MLVPATRILASLVPNTARDGRLIHARIHTSSYWTGREDVQGRARCDQEEPGPRQDGEEEGSRRQQAQEVRLTLTLILT